MFLFSYTLENKRFKAIFFGINLYNQARLTKLDLVKYNSAGFTESRRQKVQINS